MTQIFTFEHSILTQDDSVLARNDTILTLADSILTWYGSILTYDDSFLTQDSEKDCVYKKVRQLEHAYDTGICEWTKGINPQRKEHFGQEVKNQYEHNFSYLICSIVMVCIP